MALPLLSLVPGFIKGIWGMGTDLINYKREVTKAKHDVKLEAIKSSSDWELAKITEVGGSWKDEFWTIVLATPAILIFVAPVVELFFYPNEYHKGDFIMAVIGSMKALDQAPDWYITSFLTAVTASFGIKGYNYYKSNGRKEVAAQAVKEFGLKVIKKVTHDGDKTEIVEAGPDGNNKPGSTDAWSGADLSKK